MVVFRGQHAAFGGLPNAHLGITLTRQVNRMEGKMNRRISFLVVVLAVAGILTVHGAFSQVTIQPTRRKSAGAD